MKTKEEIISHKYDYADEMPSTLYVVALSTCYSAMEEYAEQFQKEHCYTEQEVLSMLEDLRQRCAEEVCRHDVTSANDARIVIMLIDLNEFLPPLNK